MSMPQDVAGLAIARVNEYLHKVFSEKVLHEVFPDVPVPRVTLDLPGQEPEPLHVFTWGTARDFDATGFLTGASMEATFHVWVTVVASSSTSEEASRIANAYQALVMQMSLVKPTLDGLASYGYAPVIRESESWADASGRRHAGYLIDLGYETIIGASQAVALALEKE